MKMANGAVVDIDAWYEAFDLQARNKMFIPKEKRMLIW
jgi:predicted metalloendopeptidase